MALRELVRLGELRERLAREFALDIPAVGDLDAYRAAHDEACGRIAARDAALEARRKGAAQPAEAGDEPAPFAP